MSSFYIRPAVAADLDGLLVLENACFASDRLTRRQFRYMLARAQAVMLVAAATPAAGDGGLGALAIAALLGYVLVLFNRATSVARLYSIAVAAAARGQGVGRALVEAAEQATWDAERAYLRLEIRRDNLASQRLFEGLGYRCFGSYRIYAEKCPHWVVVTGFDERFVYVHDPYVDYDRGEIRMDSMNMPIQLAEFRRTARYGRVELQAVVLISLAADEGRHG